MMTRHVTTFEAVITLAMAGVLSVPMLAGAKEIQFDHVGQGLAFRNGDRLQGFAVAGADGKFAWADAVIAGNRVVLSCDKVDTPVSIRYAWTSAPHPWANLFNKDGLPALPFTTDNNTAQKNKS